MYAARHRRSAQMEITMKPVRFILAFGTLVLSAAVAYAQGGQDFSKVEIKANKVTDKFYTLDGQGGTIGVLFGPDGVFMVDTQFAPLSDKIAAAIKQLTPQPIKFVVNTHLHGDHSGGDENFGKMGATIISREELRFRLAHPNPHANGQPGVPTACRRSPEADLSREADAAHERRGGAAHRHSTRAYRRRHDGLLPRSRHHHDRRLLSSRRSTPTWTVRTVVRCRVSSTAWAR